MKKEGEGQEYGRFFGQYLVDQGLISSDQLREAAALQQENNLLLGIMALNKGYLSQAQLEAILDEQKKINKKFGQIAYERNWMNQDQINELLQEQSKNHCFLGNALTRLGYLKSSILHEHLEDFRQLEKAKEEKLLSAIDRFDSPVQVKTALELTKDLFYRHGFMIKAYEVKLSIPEDMDGECFLAVQKGRNGHLDYFGLLLRPGLINLMAQGNLCSPQTTKGEDQKLNTVSELIFNLNYMICNQLREKGLKLKPGQVLNRSLASLPEHRTSLTIVLRTVTDPLALLYFLH